MTEDQLFSVDTEGWIARNAGREPWEMFREVLQNALDTGQNIEVEINTRGREITVYDHGQGYDKIEHAWTIFGGDKGDDPTKRGRFSRGIKEVVAGCEEVSVETTSGMVEFAVDREDSDFKKEVNEDITLDQGTKVRIYNSNWSTEQMQEMRDYVDKLWMPEDQEMVVDVSGGKTKTKKHKEPSYTFDLRLPTVLVKDGVMQEEKRKCEVQAKFAGGAGNPGKVYEMGIPVALDWDAPYEINIKQRIPMQEQRNEVDSQWKRKFLPKFIDEMLEHLPDDELNSNWVKNHIDSYYLSNSTKEEYVRRVFNPDGDSKDVVTSADASADDKAQQYGYEVVETDELDNNTRRVLEQNTDSAKDVQMAIAQAEEEQVEPSDEQAAFADKMLELVDQVDRVHTEQIDVEFWELAPDDNGNQKMADFSNNTVRLNVEANRWNEITPETVGAFVHEVSHQKGTGHDHAWSSEMERIFSELLVAQLE